MKILLLSDTHGYMDERILNYAEQADQIWHAGDFGTIEVARRLAEVKPLVGVWGNIDGREIRSEFPLDNRFELNGVTVWITHIAGYPGHFDKRVRPILHSNPPGVLVCGHSHILKVMRDPVTGTLCMNPGAAGISGFHKIRTMLRFEINKGHIENPEVIELGLRATLR